MLITSASLLTTQPTHTNNDRHVQPSCTGVL